MVVVTYYTTCSSPVLKSVVSEMKGEMLMHVDTHCEQVVTGMSVLLTVVLHGLASYSTHYHAMIHPFHCIIVPIKELGHVVE